MAEFSKRSFALFTGFLSQPSIFLTYVGIPFYLLLVPLIIRYSKLYVLAIIGPITFIILFYLSLISPDSNAIRDSIQLFVDVLGGYILYSYFKHKGIDYLNHLIEQFIKFLFFLNLYLLFEYYTGARILLSLLSYITYWDVGQNIVPKMGYIWANSNSAGFCIVMLMMFYSCTSKKINENTFSYAALLLGLIASKTCFAIFILIAIYTFNKRKLNLNFFSILTISLSLIFFALSIYYLADVGLFNSSSWLNRSVQLDILTPLISFFPNGWPSEFVMQSLFDSSYEDTMAGILLYLYLFGYVGLIPIFLYLLIFIITRKRIPLVFLCFLALSFTISTLSISGLIMIALFLIITVNNLKNEELYL